MLRSTFYTFTTALRGMNSAQKGLDVTGHNISNAKTPGYTRQRADIYAAVAGGYGDRYATKMSTMAGQGTIVDSISQIRDRFLDVRFRQETAIGSEDATKLTVMKDMEQFLNEIEKSGLQDSFNTLVTRLQQLSRNVESPEFDNLVRDAAQGLAMQLNHYARKLKNVREGQEYNLREVDVPEINETLKKIAELNRSIREVQANGGPALELKDERNMLLDKLSGHVDINVKYVPNYIAGDLMVEDVTISLVGKNKENGNRTERAIVHNDAASKLSVETQFLDGTKKAYVTVDATELPAKDMYVKLEGFLRTMANANAQVMHTKNTTSENFDKYKEFMSNAKIQELTNALTVTPPMTAESITKLFDKPTVPPATPDQTIEGMSKEDFLAFLQDKVDTIDKLLKNGKGVAADDGPVIAKLKEVVAAHVAASDAYHALLSKKPPATEQELKDAVKAFNDAAKAEEDWQFYRTGLSNIRKEIEYYRANLADAKTQIERSDAAIKQILKGTTDPVTGEERPGIEAELIVETDGDYNTSVYKFKKGGAYIQDKDGNPIVWKAGGMHKELTREDLESKSTGLGIDFKHLGKELFGSDFEGDFDFEGIENQGALRGSLKMLNENGQYDYGSTANTVRGTGFYERLLDTLAEKLATTMNSLNDRKSTLDVQESLFQIDPHSKVKDRFTAENIRISQDWLEGKYRLTASQEVQPEKDPKKASARNENLLLMISTITQRLSYDTGIKAEKNKYGLYVDPAGNAVADTIDKDGNYIQTKVYENGKLKVPETLLAVPKKIANRDGIKYRADGTLDLQADEYIQKDPTTFEKLSDKAYTNGRGVIIADGKDAAGNYVLNADPQTGAAYAPPRWTADPSGVLGYVDVRRNAVIANHIDPVTGNYVMRTYDAGGVQQDVIVANKDGYLYDAGTATFTTQKVEIAEGNKVGEVYIDNGTIPKKIIADGKDAQGNHVLRFDGLNELKPPRWVADANGVLGYKNGNGNVIANHIDDEGNYVMRNVGADGKITDKLVANKDGILYKIDANGNLMKDKNGFYQLKGNADGIKHETRSFVYKGTFQEYLTNIGNILGLDISSTNGLVENHKTVLNDIQQQKDSVSKVDLDEEGVNILMYQKAYNASARLMTALDEAVDKIINGMGVVGR